MSLPISALDCGRLGALFGAVEKTDSIGDPLFQQDNAPIHKAKKVTGWFKSVNVDTMEHSPDLYPIK
jgi:hypothetical protein